MSLEIDDDCPACGPGAPAACGDCDDDTTKETIMTRTATRHTSDCKISHPRDVDCAEAAWIRGNSERAARRECPSAPSRTEPYHAFDLHADGGECEYCGTPWDPSRDGDADV